MNEEQLTQEPEVTETRDIVFEEALEAVLFAAGHPVSYATIARVLDMTPSKVKELTMSYAEKYNACDIPRGVILLTFSDSAQLCTKEYYLHEIREALGVKKSGSLSTSSMEALAIIAYNQPTTRLFVDTLRRADSSYAMNNLLDRGLIECVGRMDVPGRPMLYATTKDFLRCFGFNDISDLPRTSEDISDMFASIPDVDAEGAEPVTQLTLDVESVGGTVPEDEDAPSAEDDILPDENPEENADN